MINNFFEKYHACNRCVMDTSDPDISFLENGNCNNCNNAIKRLQNEIYTDEKLKINKLNAICAAIKENGKNNKYDCIIGLSGGVDSSYLAYLVVAKLGLRPLAVHLDNGWNSELAVANINNIVKILNIDLYTKVLDWSEFKSLQLSFLKASVIDIEMLTDHAIGVSLFEVSKKFNIKYFLSGYNYQSESIMPSKWLYPYKMDSLNIKDIYRKYGNGKKIRSFKFLSFYEYLTFGKNSMELIPILNYVDYNKKEALKTLEKELNWRNYGNKHNESIFTKFYQDVILPRKFNVDKRKAHLSSLICSDQITREEALLELNKPIISEKEFERTLEYFLKKLELSYEDYQKIMMNKPKDHWEFKSYAKIKYKVGNILRHLKLK